MGVLLRSLKLCLTSEGQQAVLAVIICLLALQMFLDSTAALQVSQGSMLRQWSFCCYNLMQCSLLMLQ